MSTVTFITVVHDDILVTADFMAEHLLELEGVLKVEVDGEIK